MKLGNLLIVDDEELLVKNIKFLLQDYADQIFTAYDGEEGQKVLSSEQIHCVVCDINMPKMNGIELIKKVRESGSDVPFIFYTAYGDYDLMLETAKYGAFDFLRKPDFAGLEECVSNGLKEGFKRSLGDKKNQKDIMSEYEEILKLVNKISPDSIEE